MLSPSALALELDRLERNLRDAIERIRLLEQQLAEYRKSPEAILAEYGYGRDLQGYEGITKWRDLLKIHAENILLQAEGNMLQASRLLGVDVKTLYNWVENLGVRRPRLIPSMSEV